MKICFWKHGATRQSLSMKGTRAIMSSPQRINPSRVHEISLAASEIHSPVAYVYTNIHPLAMGALRSADQRDCFRTETVTLQQEAK